ncbi:MAG: sporulation transcription factor Spo0A [Acutalibacteraceae bacterium]|nr:sporulation transcription factor Spo0A [Acutalibacteraceae bacterium]
MEEQIKIIIADGNTELGKNCAKAFESFGADVVICEKDGKRVLSKIKSEKPDIVLADVFMPNLDIFGVLNKVNNMTEFEKPLVMAMSSFDNEALEKEMMDAGASYYFLKPFDIGNMTKFVMNFSKHKLRNSKTVKAKATDKNILELQITEVLHKAGIPVHIKGYQYLREAIMLTVNDSEMLSAVTKRLYPTVAEIFGTTDSRVERAIRHAITVAWERNNPDTLNRHFGYCLYNDNEKPTNSEFIAMVSDSLKLNLR